MGTELAKALVAAQAEFDPVTKAAQANYGKYATLDEIIEKTRPILNRHGLVVTQFPEVAETGQPLLRTTITHTSGESVSHAMPLLLQKQDMQALGSAITYARRYAWASALGIAAEEDDDGNQASGREPRAAPSAAPARRQQRDQAAPSEPSRPGIITKPQVTRLWTIARGRGLTDEDVKFIVTSIAAVESSREIPAHRYEQVIAAIEEFQSDGQAALKVPDEVRQAMARDGA